ncbi:MAG: NADH-quinone oxidoreductase subunit L [Anaerolineaceae bacterium]
MDTLSVTMMMAVSGVGTLIHIYAAGYMHRDVRHNGDEGRYTRFFVFFNLFLVAMLTLVTANNYLMLFVGWEGVGLCSYLLIGFWFEKGANGLGNAKAAKKAFIVNRIGDFGLLIAMFLIFRSFGSLDFDAVFNAAPQVAQAMPGVLLAITLFMLLGVTGKSAQLPLYVWLPDAMAGPTPVSALIHAATMVTAGVYLMARSQALFSLAPTAMSVVMWVGTLTAFFAATIAVAQNDIKKVLAYSTISQLGFMVAAVGMGAVVAGMFHLVTHAFFKALLFLAAGSVILGMEGSGHHDAHGEHAAEPIDPQDMRNMGGLRSRMKTTFWVYVVGALALSGIAPLAGFFSKDEILAAASQVSPVVFILLLAAAFLTAFYMGRQLLMVFFGHDRTEEAARAVENPAIITLPLVILAVLSFFGGALNLPGILTLEHWLEHSLGATHAGEFITPVALGSLVVALGGLLVAWLVYGRREKVSKNDADPLVRPLGFLFNGMKNKWWVDEMYGAVIVRPFKIFTAFLTKQFDLVFIDGIGNGLGKLTRAVALSVRQLQNGFVRFYAVMFLLGVIAIFSYLLWYLSI